MNGFRRFCKSLALPMVAVMLLASMPLHVARAAMVTTEQAVDEALSDERRARVESFLAREDVRRQITAMGVDPEEAARRVAGLNDAEIGRIAEIMDRDPAGQSAVGAIVGAILVIFIILLITDLLGWTDVFPFVKSGPR